ncbi:MAG: putative signal transduction histidine kinase [Flavipsychrobacter sp.]|jgi:ligand-binding sensor domain-containing protein/signal transduction histidine kinase|nr:putative signal transduction histidine kinase [Flavipsychrobacter sp.]
MDFMRIRRSLSLVKTIWVFPVLLLLSVTITYAQRYPFHNLNVDDGLIQSQATCVTQDKMGNLWIGTLGGLSRYDGSNFTGYTIRNGLQNNTIWSVATDNTGSIWIGSEKTISRFDGKNFTHFSRQQEQTRVLNHTQQIYVVNDTTWWRVAGDVYYITGGKIKYYVTPGDTGYVSSILAEKNHLWIAKKGVLYHQYENKVDTVALPLQGGTTRVYDIFRDKNGAIWIGSNTGLYKLVRNNLVAVSVKTDSAVAQPVITAITQDKSGALWLAINNGVIKVEGSSVQHYNKRNGLSDNNFFEVFTDIEGNIWMASDGQGVFRYSGTQFTSLNETMGMPSAQIIGIASNKKDSLFLGTYDAGLYIFKDGKISPLSFPSNPVPSITSLCYTRRSKLWIGTRGRGLWSYDKGIFRQYVAPERNFPSIDVNCVYEDPEERLWIGFANGALLFEHDSFKTVPTKNTRIASFLAIGRDSVLIGEESGLLLYHNGEVTEFKTNTGADSFVLHCFTMQGRNLWMGSPDNGVVRYNLDTRKVLIINKNDGLRSDFIYNIIADDEGNIWVGTGFGIHKIRMNVQDEPEITFYGKAQGINGMESNINSVLKLPDGSIWFGTTNGAVHYQPRSAVVSSAPVSIVLQSVKLTAENTIDKSYYDSSDNWYGIPYNLRLPYKKNNIAFTFHAVSLSGSQILYRYRMEGLETPWSEWSTTNSVTYSALPPGKYVFVVQCQYPGQTTPELRYEFEIITPFQKTTWFRFAVLIACLLTGILLQYLVNSKKQRRQLLLEKLRSEEQVKIRLRTAEDFHDEIGNKLTRINVLTNVLKNKTQLNPESLRILGQIEDNTAQLYGGTRDILWSLKPSNDNLYEILHRIRDFGMELFEDTEMTFTFSGTDDKWKHFRLPMDMSRNLIMIFKEALNNSLKYSRARNVVIEVQVKGRNTLQMVLKDDGQGFDVHTATKGNGINNMHIRAERLHGKLYVDSRPGKGTIINLTFKIPQNR